MRLIEMKEGILLWGLPSRQGIAEIKKQVTAAQGLSVVVPEMRPSLLGLKIAKILVKENIKHVYASDNMMGILFYQRKIKGVIFCYKDFADKHFWGICGSLYVCLLARLHHVSIKPMQGEKIINRAQGASLMNKYTRFQYNHMLPAEDEAVHEAIIQ